jgi:hypothetical protein
LTPEPVAKIFGYFDLPSLFAASFVCKTWHVALHYHTRYSLFSTQIKTSYTDCVLYEDSTQPAYQQLTPSDKKTTNRVGGATDSNRFFNVNAQNNNSAVETSVSESDEARPTPTFLTQASEEIDKVFGTKLLH